MLRDVTLSQTTGPTGHRERRTSDRVPYPAELVIVWNHDLESAVRYPVLDASDRGFRIRSSMPLSAGTTGIALRLLPEGHPLDRSLVVIWTRPCPTGDGHEVGLRLF